MTSRAIARGTLGWAASVAILAACALALGGRVAAVDASGGLPALAPFAAAMAIDALANGVLVAAWLAVLAAVGAPLEAHAAGWVWSVSQLARYTLGSAQIGGREAVGRRYGLPAWVGAATALVEIVWSGAITAALALATAPWWLPGAAGLTWLAWTAALPAAGLLVGLARPDLPLRFVASALSRRAGLRRLAPGGARLGRATAARITGLYALNSGLRAGAFLLLFSAVGGSVLGEGLRAVGALALGQLAGWLAVFAPGGLGAREGVTMLAVAPAIGGGPALTLVAAVRLAELLGETLFALAARLHGGAGEGRGR